MILRPFFPYYGSKWRIAKRYPAPIGARIIEPFAGGAGYSLRHAGRSVLLVDIDETIAALWAYLVQAKESEILALPLVPPGGSIDDFALIPEAKALIGFWLNPGSAQPKKTPSSRMLRYDAPGSSWSDRTRRRIAQQLRFIRHWGVACKSYEDLPDAAATWFVDPPYQTRPGRAYRYSSIGLDFGDLAQWCMTRTGRVIVCEQAGSLWLPFDALCDAKSSRAGRPSAEVCYIKPETLFDRARCY